jgi:hypothetical protein
MGLMDKVKQQAEQALAKAQQGVSQGQAKIDQVQAKRQGDVLLRDLGAAYYAMQRSGGPADAVDAAMKLVDEHVASHGSVGGPDDASTPGGTGGTSSASAAPSASAQPGTQASAQPGTAAGNFSIDDM